MSQYQQGTVSVTNGSNVVTGSGTAWQTAGIISSNIFTKSEDNVAYSIASVDSDTQITLTANYGGSTSSASNYGITIDFTPNGLPLLSSGDLNTDAIYNEAMLAIDNDFSSLGTAASKDLTDPSATIWDDGNLVKTISNIDTDTTHVLTVQDGGVIEPMANMDWNAFDTGVNAFVKGTSNSPTGSNVFGFQSSDGANYCTRFVGRNSTFYAQSVENAVVGSWAELWTTINTTVDVNGFIKEL